MENIVLDTNCLISSLKRTSIYYPIWRDFILGKYCLCFSDEILDEYEEIIEQRTGSAEIAHSVVNAIINRSNTRHIEIYYHFDLIKADKDDNKFVDFAIKATAK
jgi:putative PIN family toxin of toxin-antitoxin system